MTTYLIWLTALLGGSLASVTILVVVLGYHTLTRWTRILCEKQGIPAISMESKSELPTVKTVEKQRPRISVPVPGMAMFKPKFDKPQ